MKKGKWLVSTEVVKKRGGSQPARVIDIARACGCNGVCDSFGCASVIAAYDEGRADAAYTASGPQPAPAPAPAGMHVRLAENAAELAQRIAPEDSLPSEAELRAAIRKAFEAPTGEPASQIAARVALALIRERLGGGGA